MRKSFDLRRGIVSGTLAMFALATVSFADDTQQAGKVIGGSEKHSGMQIQISGRVDMKYVNRDSTIDETGENIRTGTVPTSTTAKEDSDNFATGRVTLRFDVDVKDKVKTVVELESKSVDGYGTTNAGNYGNLAWGNDNIDIDVEQAYLDLGEFVVDKLSMRMGVQDVKYALRANGDAFFCDISESESFFAGVNTAGTAIRNSMDRDVSEAVGAKAHYECNEWIGTDLVAVTVDEGGNVRNDEALYLCHASFKPTDNLGGFGLAAVSNGNAVNNKGDEVWTFGGGVDLMMADKVTELFGEYYMQTGDLRDDASLSPDSISKRRAHAYRFGGRYTGKDGWWLEGSYELKTGDSRASDTRDNTFQSYENVDTLVIVEDNELGLDVDTNYSALKGAVSYGPIDLGDMLKNVSVRSDIGFFKSDEPWATAAGTEYVRGKQNIGTEWDNSLLWAYNDSVMISFKLAYLANSEITDRLTPKGEESSFMTVFGADVRF